MSQDGYALLVVDDNEDNCYTLTHRLKRLGYTNLTTAVDGRQALELLRAQRFDLVLLDIMMPDLNGYQVLEQLKADEKLRHIPVIMISAVDEIESVIRCIELGAEDYLPKPFNPTILRARISASLARKRLRDLELEYLEQVGHVVAAAEAVEAETFDPESLDGVAARGDALGQLARVFQRMAREVHTRQERLKQQVRELRIEIDGARKAREVEEITDTEFFRALQERAGRLKNRPSPRE